LSERKEGEGQRNSAVLYFRPVGIFARKGKGSSGKGKRRGTGIKATLVTTQRIKGGIGRGSKSENEHPGPTRIFGESSRGGAPRKENVTVYLRLKLRQEDRGESGKHKEIMRSASTRSGLGGSPSKGKEKKKYRPCKVSRLLDPSPDKKRTYKKTSALRAIWKVGVTEKSFGGG